MEVDIITQTKQGEYNIVLIRVLVYHKERYTMRQEKILENPVPFRT